MKMWYHGDNKETQENDMNSNTVKIEVELHEETGKYHAIVNYGEHVTALYNHSLNAHIAGSHWAWLQGYDNYLPVPYRKRWITLGE